MSIAKSAALQFRAVKSLIMRRFRTRYRGSRVGYAWAIIEPLAWVFILKFGLAHGSNQPPIGTSYEVFFTTGVVLARTWRSTANSVMTAVIRPSRNGFPLFGRMDQVFAVWIMDSITGAVVAVIILSILGVFGFDAAPMDLLSCIVTYACLAVFSLSFGLMFALVATVAPFMLHFRSIIFMAMFFTSGFATVLDRMPPAFRDFISWNPLVHFIEWFREGFYHGYECMNRDLEYVFTLTVAFLLLGLAGERAFRRRTALARA
ncbi:transport permease protein [Methylopila jiangsuensis]|uniref:Transport permease protein n=1 Tax=Methylopila jiangsuensis TaxID=586230 RepID=A0A9W6JK99_9HYPH|nr:ABC transporter permease [Methylopila jiangsuensis]MDR6284861.1 capsular polysaccharide transport system permease protein [Methylopila jiangsuensis]GLK77748.1 transport permease protein [Methylopila jiangsuensis]